MRPLRGSAASDGLRDAAPGRARPAGTQAASVLVAGVGNVLRGDDGFGPAVIQELERRGGRPGVRTVEVGIGGMGIIQELLVGASALVVVDAVQRDSEPGTLHLLRPEIPAPETLDERERLGLCAGAHQLGPTRMLIQARALGVLPGEVYIIGCQPAETEELTTTLSPAVAAALPRALDLIDRLLLRMAGTDHID